MRRMNIFSTENLVYDRCIITIHHFDYRSCSTGVPVVEDFFFLTLVLSRGLKTPALLPRLALPGVNNLAQVGQVGENQSACVVDGGGVSSFSCACAEMPINEKKKINAVNFIKIPFINRDPEWPER